jgi:hypothetical protein
MVNKKDMKKQKINRRQFFGRTAAALGGFVAFSLLPVAASEKTEMKNSKSGFTLWQLPSHVNTIGNSYVMRTNKGRIIVMDGGMPQEAPFIRGFIDALGGEVEAWFISHPHSDHMGALSALLPDLQHLKIKQIYHSRLAENLIDKDEEQNLCREFYDHLEKSGIPVKDIQDAGQILHFDEMNLQILSVQNPEFEMNAYNNSSMIMRVWDKRKSVLFLGDAGVECGDKVLQGTYGHRLDSEYIQMAHHGQNGCSQQFYKSVKFRVCLWPTPLWVWNNDGGKGFNTANLKTVETRHWMDELGIKEHHVTCLEGMWRLD